MSSLMRCFSSLVLGVILPLACSCTAGEADAAISSPAASLSVPGPGAALVPPEGFRLAAQTREKDARDCPTDASPYTATLDFPSRYEGSDKARDDVNEAAQAKYRKLIAPISAMEKGLVGQVDDYLRSGNAESLACATDLLRRWSAANALMGEAANHTGKSMRKWAMASVASAYLRLKFSASQPLSADPTLMQQVEGWLSGMATRVVQEWTDQPLDKINNHEYWAAWAVMAVSVAVNRRDLYAWSMKQFDTAMRQVTDEGYLPNELRRDTRALLYHNYALPPLVMIAAFAKANGQTPDEAKRAALARLVDRVLAGVSDPDEFENKTGKKQVQEFGERSKFAWLEPYCWTFACAGPAQQKLDQMRPVKSTRLGGNVTDIFGPARTERARSGAAKSAS